MQGPVAAPGNVFLYPLGIDEAAIAQGNFYLFGEERQIFVAGNVAGQFRGVRIGVGTGDALHQKFFLIDAAQEVVPIELPGPDGFQQF